MKAFLILAVVIAAASCGQPEADARLGSPYRLSSGAFNPAGGKVICYQRTRGGCDLRTPASVIAYGADAEFVTAAVRAWSDPTRTDYYFIVRAFDDPEADGAKCVAEHAAKSAKPTKVNPGAEAAKKGVDCEKLTKITEDDTRPSNCAVRGPFGRAEFNALRKCHCVPEALGSTTLKCIPDVTTPVP